MKRRKNTPNISKIVFVLVIWLATTVCSISDFDELGFMNAWSDDHHGDLEITIYTPVRGATIYQWDEIIIEAVALANVDEDPILRIEFYVNDVLESTTEAGVDWWTWPLDQAWTPTQAGRVEISMIVYDKNGASSEPYETWYNVEEVVPATPTPTLTPTSTPTPISNATISDFIWEDLNKDGLQDADEVGMGDVEVVLYTVVGDEVDATMTDADGFYLFDDVEPGEYYLVFTAPDGYLFTLMDEGDDDSVDSDADDAGVTFMFLLGPGEDKDDVDAGLITGQVSGGAICPLTGLPVENPEDLDRRPIAMSISHFPPDATRPPTGINWAPFVYEFFIGEGQTRLFSIFYCGYPKVTYGEGGGEETPPDESNYPGVGNWVWGDVDADGIQDVDANGNWLEPGVPDITVKLFTISGKLVGETITDLYGYYFFGNLAPGEYYVTFNTGRTGYEFTYYQEGNDPTLDSDALSNGVTQPFMVTEGYLDDIDAGLVIVTRIEGVRSGRVAYVDFAKYFNAGLIYQGADPKVEAVIGNMKCASASSSDSGDIGSGGVDVTRLKEVAAECQTAQGNPDLAVYNFGPMPIDGEPAPEFMMFYNIFNRTHWVYDEALGGYVRYQNNIEKSEVFTMSTDRLSGEPVVRANVIVLFTRHTVQNSAGTIIDVDLDYQQGKARLFRDGMMYEICWDTQPGSYATSSNRLRPILFTDCHGTILPLALGSTWVNVVDTTAAFYYDGAKGWWYGRFYTPQYNP